MANEVSATPPKESVALADIVCNAIEGERAKSQAFFAQLAAEMRRPSFGEMQADTLRNILIRAQEAGIYKP